MILSLQGCMAVGKTTVARYLEQPVSYTHLDVYKRQAMCCACGSRAQSG